MALRYIVTLTLVAIVTGKIDFSLDDVTALVGETFQYQVGDQAFLDVYRIYKIVERGQKRLPDWLQYHKDNSSLTGTPQIADLGSYTLKLRAECKEPDGVCQEKLSRNFHIKVMEPLKSEESRGRPVVHMHVGAEHFNTNRKPAAPDNPPTVQNSIDHLIVMVGRYYEYKIPENTFLDKEDGNTRNLTLNISLVFNRPVPKDGWLMFNSERQLLYGIPLKSDVDSNDTAKVIDRFVLIATDSQGQSIKDVISLTYTFEKDITHQIALNMNSSYFGVANRTHLINIAHKLAKFYGDADLRFITFFAPMKDPLVRPIVWGNNSLFGEKCERETIEGLLLRLVYDNDTVRDQFSVLFQSDPVLSVDLFFSGVCILPVTTLPPPTKAPVAESSGDKMWVEIVIPALVAILVIVIIALLLLVCCRHSKPSKQVPAADKPMFLEDRRPIIFPEELELLDPSMKPNHPLVLPADYLKETPPAVPPHGKPSPPYRAPPTLDNDDIEEPIDIQGRQPEQQFDPPPYRLPPPYFNPHRAQVT